MIISWLAFSLLGQSTYQTVSSSEIGQETFASWLNRNCLGCHSGLSPSGELDLTSLEKSVQGGESGSAWTPEDPWSSPLWEAVESGSMPPNQALSSEEIETLRSLIEQEELWPTKPIDPLAFTTDARAGYDWWSFQSLQTNTAFLDNRPTSAPNASSLAPAATSPIDVFIDTELKNHGLHRSPRADARTLLRRLHFGLTGLPAGVDDISKLESNSLEVSTSTQANYVDWVDRLLNTPEFGERFGRYWLDLIRFGETNGFEYDEPRNHFWRFRNWVIQSFNDDMPYDEFARMQLAGDAILPNHPAGAIAAGFLVAGPHNTTLPSGNDLVKLAMREDEVEELVGTISQTFLGLTVHCARCHDHKFDPISQANYYEFAANFAGVAHGEREVQLDVSARDRSELQRLRAIVHQLTDEISSHQTSLAKQQGEGVHSSHPKLANLPKAVIQWPSPLASRRPADQTWAKVGRPEMSGNTDQRYRIVLDGESSYLESKTIDRTIGAKTLSAWVQLNDLQQRGGGVLSIYSTDEKSFDSIVFGEQSPSQWLVGSENFKRTQSLMGPEETIAVSEPVHVAVTYHENGLIELFRNGQRYGSGYDVGQQITFEPNQFKLLIGLRHKPAGGNRSLAGQIFYAALFDRVLTDKEIELQASNEFLEMQTELARGFGAAPGLEVQLAELDSLMKLKAESETRLAQLDNETRAKVYSSIGRPIGESRIYKRGEVGLPGDVVQPSSLKVLDAQMPPTSLSSSTNDAERRTAAANWITSRQNVLFARVMANRIWMYHMGSSLVETPSDFGFNGGNPTHPELLDYLANLLLENDFHLKPLHRAILLSETYRQSSRPSQAGMAIDSNNRLYWRKSRERLEAEEIRDSLLQISGRLHHQRVGSGYRDMEQKLEKGTNVYTLLDLSDQPVQRRTMYRFSTRGSRNPFLENFDCPDPSVTTPKRSQTTTPLQALSLMNNSLTGSVCESLGRQLTEDMESNPASVQNQVDQAYRMILQRFPAAHEQTVALAFVSEHGIANLCRVLLNTNEFLYVQ